MTKQLQVYCALLLVGLASPSLAQERLSRPAAGGGSLMRALDKNNDGELDQSEIDLAVASLRKLDKNKDGKVSKEEMGAQRAPERTGDAQARRIIDFSTLDKNDDGKISKEEAPERMKERFDRMDQNADGFLDKKEQEDVLNFVRRRMQEGGNGQGNNQRREGRDEGQGGSEKPKRPQADES